MTTLAETRGQLGHLLGRVEEHKPGGSCHQCAVAKKPALRCDERHRLDAEIKDLREQIRTWFDPPPGSAQLDLDLGLES